MKPEPRLRSRGAVFGFESFLTAFGTETPRRRCMSVDLVRIVDSIHRDKNISKDILFEGIQSALTIAARKHKPDAGEIEVRIDPDSGAIDATKDVVKMDPAELVRISAQTAKQVII